MYTRTVTALVALLAVIGDVAAGPVERRVDASSTASSTGTLTGSSTGTATGLSSSTTGAATATATATGTTTPPSVTSASATGPITLSVSSAGGGDADRTSSSVDMNLPRPSNAPTNCHNMDGDYAPFCSPTNGTDVWAGSTYYVTWDPDAFVVNTTVEVILQYANQSTNRGPEVWRSDKTPNSYGFVSVQMSANWLKNQPRNNLTVWLFTKDPTPDQRAEMTPGPIISLILEPAEHYPSPPKTGIDKKGLYIGLPVGLAVFVFILFGLFYGFRKHRQIGLGVLPSRRKGYGGSAARRQRMDIGKGGAIRLAGESVSAVDERFRDVPTSVELQSRGHNREVSLGSLVSETPTEDSRFNVSSQGFRGQGLSFASSKDEQKRFGKR